MDASSALLMTLGAAALLISWILLLITSFNEDYAWGLFSLLLPPAGYTYGLFRLDKARQRHSFGRIGLGTYLSGLVAAVDPRPHKRTKWSALTPNPH